MNDSHMCKPRFIPHANAESKNALVLPFDASKCPGGPQGNSPVASELRAEDGSTSVVPVHHFHSKCAICGKNKCFSVLELPPALDRISVADTDGNIVCDNLVNCFTREHAREIRRRV